MLSYTHTIRRAHIERGDDHFLLGGTLGLIVVYNPKRYQFYLMRGSKIRHFLEYPRSNERTATLDDVVCKAQHCLNGDIQLVYWVQEESIVSQNKKLLLCLAP